MGIDPGRITGYGVLEERDEGVFLVEAGRIGPSASPSSSMRLKFLFDGLLATMERLRPEVAVVEGVFVHRNARAALKLGEAKGIALLAAAFFGIPVKEYSPAEVKEAVTSFGKASKEQVREMVKEHISGGKEAQGEWEGGFDPSDATAVALCHLFSYRAQERIREAAGS